MASLNKVMLIGNVTRDLELRYTPKGTAVTEIGLAVNRRYRVDDETREETTFVDITFWGKQAETLNQYVKKGNPIYCEGRLQLDTWDDKTSGQKRSKLRVVGENFQFLGGRNDGGGGSSGGGGGGGGYQGGPQAQGGGQSPSGGGGGQPQGGSRPVEDADDDEIPF